MTPTTLTPNSSTQLDPLPLTLDVKHPIAYFSAEYAIENSLPLYAGGLGVLAGDMVLEAGSDGVPMIAFGTMYAHGFNVAGEKDSRLNPLAAGFELLRDTDGNTLTARVVCNDRVILIQGWQKYYGSARMILLDSDNPNNSPDDRATTGHLYEKSFVTRLNQEWLVGLAAVQFLKMLDIQPSVYHLNEGHTACVAIGLIIDYLDNHEGATIEESRAAVRSQIVASKHTILPGAGLFVDRIVMRSVVGAALHDVDFNALFVLGETEHKPDHFSATKFMLEHARAANGVSRLHVEREKIDHADSPLIPITNGVHRNRWLAQNFLDHHPDKLSDDELWKAHIANRSSLIATVNDTLGSHLSPDTLTVVWARRITAYKRPALLFHNLARLESLVTNKERPIQFIIAGKANSGDEEAMRILEEILKYCELPKLNGRVVYLPGYSVPTTLQLVAAADLWLNTPIRGQEACGTSGMKASLNGALQLSTNDGWIDEVSDTFIGWKLPEENIESMLYDQLEQEIAPLFYDTNERNVPERWVRQMRQSMQFVDQYYTAKRMLADYMNKLYFPQ